MNNNIVFILMVVLFSCNSVDDQKVIKSNDSKNSITILKNKSQYFIFDGIANKDSLLTKGYIINEGGIEYYNALVKWTEGRVYLYHTYGIFDESNNRDSIINNKIPVWEFEELKKNPEYKYFYY